MIYLSEFSFPGEDREWNYIVGIKRQCYDTFYPFQIMPRHNLNSLYFDSVTILYGGNGSGKSTVLNVIAETLKLKRDTLYNRSNFYEDFTGMCSYEIEDEVPKGSSIITSDDVFDFMLNLRSLNEGIDRKREELFDEYLDAKYSRFRMQSLKDYEQLKKVNSARSNTQSKYVKKNLCGNVREHSNGESAFIYFVDKLEEGGLYLLDEPENSLSPVKQLELVKYLEDSVRFFGCQLVIATHSPFFLAMNGAKIYDLDADPVDVKKWTELDSVRAYHDFFKEHEGEFN